MIRRHAFDLGLGNLVCKLLLEVRSSLVIVYCNTLPDNREVLKSIFIHSNSLFYPFIDSIEKVVRKLEVKARLRLILIGSIL